ncbi:Hypothetical predicted protein [Mytilus galloprovincialis]|uniref:Uncharacterized protein n=1 Tax=Mytilus galloprovincialis TaxID=29158 RepID=A0A8B6DDB5_MYTGA|nr:Hypothetical predicted protein [Mytilus galloprovincialis]
MTEKVKNKLNKFFSKPRLITEVNRKLQPVVLTDSKGNINRHVAHNAERDIIWWTKRGSKLEQSTNWRKKNIASKIIRHGNIWLYAWLGTCNLTTKNKRYISITKGNDEEVNNIIEKYEEIIKIVDKYPGSKITILETPIYSIKNWNTKQGHKHPDTFEEQDTELERQLYTLNGRIREINKRIGSHSPEFSSDISNTSKYRCGKDRKLKTKRNYEFGLFQDGIHPGEATSKKIG